ncbi:MAG: hypothetical protein A3J97_00430 [Spirochaetes bacterium RIFOXYC1_FULL_54_7]|nr:MAG: hypothetical protein A3J97_00430 [Spirochaetes bacterium RIFOXYC1_FULL_54_7]
MSRSQRLVIVVIVITASARILWAQSNTVLDLFLENEQASFGTSVYLVLVAAGAMDEDSSPADALRLYAEIGRRPLRGKQLDDPLTAGELGHVLFQALEISGGIMYSILPGPWYAAKELDHKRLLPEKKFARQFLSPFEVVYALQKALELGQVADR